MTLNDLIREYFKGYLETLAGSIDDLVYRFFASELESTGKTSIQDLQLAYFRNALERTDGSLQDLQREFFKVVVDTAQTGSAYSDLTSLFYKGFGYGPTKNPYLEDVEIFLDALNPVGKNIFFDFQDASKMYQDVAGTVPVTASGQAVARVNGLTTDTPFVIQNTLAKRPLWIVDEVTGKGCLRFDGVDDVLVHGTAISSAWTGINMASCFVSFKNNQAVATSGYIFYLSGTGNPLSVSLSYNNGLLSNRASWFVAGLERLSQIERNVTNMIAWERGSVFLSGTSYQIRSYVQKFSKNNSELTTNVSSSPDSTVTGTITNLFIGSSNANGVYGFKGDMYGLLITARGMSDTVIQLMKNFMIYKETPQ